MENQKENLGYSAVFVGLIIGIAGGIYASYYLEITYTVGMVVGAILGCLLGVSVGFPEPEPSPCKWERSYRDYTGWICSVCGTRNTSTFDRRHYIVGHPPANCPFTHEDVDEPLPPTA